MRLQGPVADDLGPVGGVNAGGAQPAALLLDLAPAAFAGSFGAAPVAVGNVGLVEHDAAQRVDVAGLDETPPVAAAHGGVGNRLGGQEVTPTTLDHGHYGLFPDPPAVVPGLRDQAAFQTAVVAGSKPATHEFATTTLARVGERLLHVSILTRPCLRVKH